MRVLLVNSQSFIGSFICDELINFGYLVTGIPVFVNNSYTFPHDNKSSFSLHLSVASNSLQLEKYDYVIFVMPEFDIQHYFVFVENLNLFTQILSIVIQRPPKKILFTVHNNSTFFDFIVDRFCSLLNGNRIPSYIELSILNYIGYISDNTYPHCKKVNLVGDSLISDLIKQFLTKDQAKPYLNLEDYKYYTNCLDIARCVRVAMESDIINDSFVIPPVEICTVLDLSDKIYSAINNSHSQALVTSELIHDSSLDWNKTKNTLGFSPSISLSQSINDIVRWVT